jgi:hypothetical protein
VAGFYVKLTFAFHLHGSLAACLTRPPSPTDLGCIQTQLYYKPQIQRHEAERHAARSAIYVYHFDIRHAFL